MKDILIVLPTRNRPENVKRFYEFYTKNTCGKSRVIVMADIDDPNDYSYTGWIIERHPRLTPIEKLNMGAEKYLGDLDVLSYMGDDAVIETKNFEDVVFEELGDNKLGIIYGQNHIPFYAVDHPFITASLYKKMGWFYYPKLFHSWMDYVLDDIGKFIRDEGLGVFFQSEKLSVRNIHPEYVEGLKKDENYYWVYREEITDKDKAIYEGEWKKKDFPRLKHILSGKMPKIILSGYEDSKKILPACSYLLGKYAPKTNIYFLNYGSYNGKLYCGEFVSLKSQQDGIKSWAGDIKDYLKRIDDEYIIFGLDDFLLANEYNSKEFENIVALKDKTCLFSLADPTDKSYSVTTQYTLWDREFLIEMLSRFETPWEFEIEGSKYFNSLNKNYDYLKVFTYDDGSALSKRHEGKVNVNLLKRDDVEELINLGHLNREDLIMSQSVGEVPRYE